MSNIINRQSLQMPIHVINLLMLSYLKIKLSTYDFSICVEITTKYLNWVLKLMKYPLVIGRTFSEGKNKFKDTIYVLYFNKSLDILINKEIKLVSLL